MASEGAGEDVATGADFERDATVGEEVHEGGIVHGSDAVTDAFDAEEFDGFANFFRAANFAGVHKAMKADRSGGIVDGTKRDGWNAQLVTTDSEGNDFF